MSDLAANNCHQTIDNPIDLKDEHTHLVKYVNSETHVDDSVNELHGKIFFYDINEKSPPENQQEATRDSNDAIKIETKSNDNEVCQETVTYSKSRLNLNIKTEKSPDELNVVNPSSQSSKLHDSLIIQRPPSYITIYKLTQTNTPSKEVKQFDLDKITEEVDTLTRQISRKKLINDLGFDDISENGT
ncbi:unnamed protein product [Mytilus coruscus]|uniref:Uncharacterized protein n=1 Tax=Mytilus coruscus TaxID=42192 RepID=A0A6J8BXB2_MYTCO|nr:unnamed protein product [Mytilus coruscus]